LNETLQAPRGTILSRAFRFLGRILARVFIALRYPVILAWIAAAVVMGLALPALGGNDVSSFASLVPPHSQALRAESVATQQFGFPLLSETQVVVRNPNGLSATRQAQLAALAARLSQRRVPGFSKIVGAIPLVNSIGGPKFSPETGTTMLLYLLFRPSIGPEAQGVTAAQLVRTQVGHRQGEYEGYTGAAPAEQAQAANINSWLKWVTLATLLVVFLAIAIHFRAPGTALLAVGTVAIAYVVANRAVEQFGRLTGTSLPAEAEPVLIVLIFGIVTDYSIFFMSRARALLAQEQRGPRLGTGLMREISPIVIVAGVTVALGVAALRAATMGYLQTFGPGLAISVLVAMLVATTFVPAVLTVGGRAMFWPRRLAENPQAETAAAETSQGETPRAESRAAAVSEAEQVTNRRLTVRVAVRHPVLSTLLVLVLIGAAASGLSRLAIGNALVRDLPPSAEAQQAYVQASHGFSEGVLAPGELLVTGPAIGSQRAALTRLQALVSRQPDMAQVFGPGQIPAAHRLGFAVSSSGQTARYAFFLHSDPLGAKGISAVQTLRDRLPGLLRQAGFRQASVLVGGDTAISADIVDGTISSLERVIPIALAAIFLVIALYLRALVAPLYLLVTSVLGVGASLGLTAWVLQDLLGYGQTAYYVLFTVGVMLISLGSDYNVFLVGRIWQEARRRPLNDAIEIGGSRAARSITTAGFVLAISFALLAIVPLRPFREIAFAMAVGLLIDAFIVRTMLVPALISLVGPRSAWPGHALRDAPAAPAPPDAAAPPDEETADVEADDPESSDGQVLTGASEAGARANATPAEATAAPAEATAGEQDEVRTPPATP
jgi:RND superfamily putative drug exporter